MTGIIKNLPMKFKIILIALFPFGGFLLISMQNLNDNYRDLDSYKQISQLSILSGNLSVMVHELQKERGLSAGFLGSKGAKFGSKLDSQRKMTDNKHQILKSYLEGFNIDAFGKELDQKLSKAQSNLAGLPNSRQGISSQRLSGDDAVSYYSSTNASLLDIIGLMAKLSDNAEINNRIIAYSNFLLAKERTGMERAVMNVVFSAGSFTAAQYKKFIMLVSEQPTYLSIFHSMATKEEIELYKNTVRGSAVDEVERMRKVAFDIGLDTSRSLDVKAEDWFTEITKKIDLLKEVDDGLSQGIQEQANQLMGLMKAKMTRSVTLFFLILGACLLITVISIRIILAGIRQTTAAAQALAKGDLEQKIEIDQRDEVGQLADAFREMIEALKAKAQAATQIAAGNLGVQVEVAGDADVLGKAMVEMISSLQNMNTEVQDLTRAALEGQLDTRADAGAHNGDFGKIVSGINELLEAVVTPIQAGASVLLAAANKDLTQRVEGNFKGQLADLKVNINATVNALDNAMLQVGNAVEQVSSASGQISSGSQSLAQGANEQASSLEEISASLEEIASMTKQNADNSNQAKTLSGSARESADKGTRSMENMTDAINRIKTSSDETAKIVKTIDEIAFQTNLLALNAAVEAARAGEAGKGFAVVAEEVRNLAQRSAEAAKDTTVMIEEAVKNAEDGVSITDEVAAVLNEIVDSSGKVNDLVAEISAAAGEQSQGIDQVNSAISQMDQVTQQNASNSEESASAAEELNSQAVELQRLVNSFKLSEGAGPAPRVAATNRLENSKLSTTAAGDHTFHNSSRLATVKQTSTASKGNGGKHLNAVEELIPLDDDDYGDF